MSTGRVYAGESAADRDARRRRQLLDAGLELFGTHGYRAATVRGICREARVADRNFYEYFPSTEDLLLAVYDECTQRLEEAASAAAVAAGAGGSGDVRAIARAGLDAFLGLVAEDPRLARVVWMEVLGVSPAVEAAYRRRIDGFAALMLALLPAGTRSVDDLRARLLSLAAVGGVTQVILDWVDSGLTHPRAEVVDVLVEHLSAVAAALDPA